MALDFPASPTLNQQYTSAGVIWSWDGAKWVSAAASPPATYATPAYVDAAVTTALHDVGRNLVHNSMFNIAQRGAGPWSTNNAYTVDRWVPSFTLDTIQYSQGAFADVHRTQIGDEAATFYLVNSFTGNAGTTAYNMLTQRIEDVRRLAGKTVTVSFWASSATGLKLGINMFQSFGSGGSPSGGVRALATGNSVTLAASLARYSTTITLPSIAGKTIGTNKDDYTSLELWCSTGATGQAMSGNIGVQSGTIVFWGVQLELGPTATPLEKLDPVLQLQQCQRFACVVNGGLQPGLATTAGIQIPFPVPMRGVPTGTNLSPGTVSNATFSAEGVQDNRSVFLQIVTSAANGFILGRTTLYSADL